MNTSDDPMSSKSDHLVANDSMQAGPSNVSDSEDEESDEDMLKKTRSVSKLSIILKALIGEANLRLARGEIDVAKKMCYEVIRQCPDAYEPYLTLSQIYENTNAKKYRGYLILASHMFPQGVDIWCRLADLYLQENLVVEAISCYSNAIKAQPKNIDLHLKRIELLESRGDAKPLLRCKLKLAKHLPKRKHEEIIKLCMDVAKDYFIGQKNFARSIEALDIPFKRIPKKVTHDLLNMLLEVLIASEKFTECLDIFIQYCGFEFEVTVNEDKTLQINSYTFPPNLLVDLKIKFVICVIKLKSLNLVPALIDSIIMNDDIELYGDLYLDVVESLMPVMPNEALKLLVPLVKSKNYSLAAIWLKYAECLNLCNMFEQSVEAYFTVMVLAPKHIGVLYPLSMLLLKLNKVQEALDVLSQDLSENEIDVAVLMERMKLLKQINRLEEYWKSAELLLSRHCIVLKYPEEIKVVTTLGTVREKITKLKKMRIFRKESDNIETNYISMQEPSIEDEYKFYREILQFAKDTKNYSKYQKFAFMGLCSKRFQKYFNEIFLSAFYSCLFNNDHYHGYTAIRDLIIKNNFENFLNNLSWNWFNVILQNPDDVRHNRFLERLQERVKHRYSSIKMIEANYEVSVNNYTGSLTFFMQEFKNTNSAYSALILGIILIQLYYQRLTDKNKKKLLAETSTYLLLHYSKTRSQMAQQEVYYNLGRMYHQFGILYLAQQYYEKALNYTNDLIEEHPEILSLKMESAYNLHTIYKQSGNLFLARKVLYENIVV